MGLEKSGVRWPWDYCIICLHLGATIKKRSAQLSVDYRVINPFEVKTFFMCPSLLPGSFSSIWFKLQSMWQRTGSWLLKKFSDKGNSSHEPSKAVYHYLVVHFIVSLDDQGIRWSSGSYGKQHIEAPSWRVTWTDRLIRQLKIHSFWEKHSYSYTWRLCICIRHGLALIEFCSKEIIKFILLDSSFL